jgi:catechol 2,3-dioxygenase-like lactoylglutathione lyase family enzyme
MVDMHLEVSIVAVSDAERAKRFYQSLGWRLDDDVTPVDGVRLIQFTPPGSACSITFGSGITSAAPGSVQGGLVVADIEKARAELVSRGIHASEFFHGAPLPEQLRAPGLHPERASYGSFVSFRDPDDNEWVVQEVTVRAPGRD